MQSANVDKAKKYLLRLNLPHLTVWVGYLNGEKSAEDVLQVIRDFQNNDGGWSRIDADLNIRLSMISNTWLGLQWLSWLQVKDHEILEKTLHFLKSHQKENGCWDEPEELVQYNPPSWMTPGNYATQLWLTSAVCCKLVELGQEDAVDFERAIRFLQNGWQNDRFPVYRHIHWMGLVIFSQYTPDAPRHREIAQGCKDFLITAIKEAQVDPADLSDIAYSSLLTREFAESLLQMTISRVLENQMDDGGWKTNYGERHRPGITLSTLFLLKKLDQIG